MGSLGQVEGVEMERRQETSAALTVEEKGQKEEDIVSIFLRRKSKILCEEKQQRKEKSLSNKLQRQLGFNL